jgi:ATP-dependent DNA ligase
MNLLIKPVYRPIKATSSPELPTCGDWQYEPKWDGFRCLAFRDGDKVELQSKAGKLLTRYFPDVVSALLTLKPKRFVLGGELVISVEGTLSFEHLLANAFGLYNMHGNVEECGGETFPDKQTRHII